MARGVQEGHLLTALFDLIGADMLGNPASFAGNNLGIPDCIQQRCLAVVNVAHDGDDRRTRYKVFVLVIDRVDHLFHVSIGNAHDLVAEFLDDQFGGVRVDRLILRHHHAVLHQRLDDIGDPFGHPVGQLTDHDGFRHTHFAHNLFTALDAAHCLLSGALLLALHRGH